MSGIIDNDELMKVFYEEAYELVEKMKSGLLSLSVNAERREKETGTTKTKGLHEEKEGTSPTFRNLFRYAHTLKSSSRAVGFGKLEEVTQALERIFKEADEKSIDIDPKSIAIISESITICGKLLKKEKVSGYKSLLTKLESITGD
jgi:chemotaxis protein histidine kinase CheA